jgi:hypothetical protein
MLPQNKRRMEELVAETRTLLDNPNISSKALKVRMDAIEAEAAEIEAGDATGRANRAKFAMGPGDDTTSLPSTKAIGGPRWNPPSPAHATEAQSRAYGWLPKTSCPVTVSSSVRRPRRPGTPTWIRCAQRQQ